MRRLLIWWHAYPPDPDIKEGLIIRGLIPHTKTDDNEH